VGSVRLYLVQHGEAKAESVDPDRPLTDRGAEDVRRVAGYAVAQLGVRPTRLVHSGRTRARQTTDIWGELLEARPEEADGLEPNGDPATWVERLQHETADLLLAGHLPYLARLAGALLAGDPERPMVRFRPGGLVGLERADNGWVLWAVLPPDGG
jgi:phosphohistidine phosphatase